jgi:hypothetical protein
VAAVGIPPAVIRLVAAGIRAEATTESGVDDVSEVKVRGERGVLNGTPFLLTISARKYIFTERVANGMAGRGFALFFRGGSPFTAAAASSQRI